MTDYTYDGAAQAPSRASAATLANWAGAAVSLALIAGVGVWGYQLLMADVSGVPVVAAMEGPMRVSPEDPGGQLADHQGLAVNAVAGQGATAGPTERLVLAPRQAGLAEEDVALGVLEPLIQQQAQPAPVEVMAPVAELEPAPSAPQEDTTVPLAALVPNADPEVDPIQALANQLAASAAPLSALADAETEPAPVVAALVSTTPPLTAKGTAAAVARSLRPQVRPNGLRVAALAPSQVSGAPVLSDAPAAVAPVTVNEIDPASLPKGTRLVQIGAYDSAETARTEWARFETRFGDFMQGRDRVIQRATSGGRVFYRLRAHGFEDLSDARRFCAAFVAKNVDCIPVVTR